MINVVNCDLKVWGGNTQLAITSLCTEMTGNCRLYYFYDPFLGVFFFYSKYTVCLRIQLKLNFLKIKFFLCF
jgi:hypothetical protein